MVYLTPTIDVEGVHGKRPFEEFVLGDIGGTETWGVYKIARILEEEGCSGTFFVDVYETTLWGEAKISEVCKRLADMGQDVQLHTHPSWRDDKRDPMWLRRHKKEHSYFPQEKDFMAKLSVNEQIAVLEHGMELLTKWLGSPPVAHRSGGYSINQGTIEALRAVGIAVDSSMNASHTNTEVCWSRNAIVQKDGLLEIPVTQGLIRYALPNLIGGSPVWEKQKKTDLDLYSLRQFRAYIEGAIASDVKLCNLFMHSYSLLDRSNGFNRVSPNAAQERKLREVLRYAIDSPNVEVVTCKQLHGIVTFEEGKGFGTDVLPEIPLAFVEGGRHLYRKYKAMLGNGIQLK